MLKVLEIYKKSKFLRFGFLFVSCFLVIRSIQSLINKNKNKKKDNDKLNNDEPIDDIINKESIESSSSSSLNNSIDSSLDNSIDENNNKEKKNIDWFKLPSDIKVHVLSNQEECDLVLNEYYQSLLKKIENSKVKVDGADVLANTTESSLSSNDALLFPNCTKENNEGLDFIIGFDAEWSNQNQYQECEGYPHKVALIQLSSKTDVYLIQISQMPTIPQSLEQILVDPRLIKVGVAISQDAATIFSSFSIVTKGCVDLVPIGRLTNYQGNGLASLALNVLNANIDKNNLIRCSHWENKNLTSEQVMYAAIDAWIGREIFETMYYTYKSSKIDPNEPDLVFTLCRPFINTQFKVKVKSKSTNGASTSENGPRVKDSSIFRRMVPDNRVLYDNCLMYSPEDVLLCSISKKKVQWYVSRGLADIVSGDSEQIKIKLRFKPNGEGHSGDFYYLAHKENHCVVCGSTYKILRHSVVPHCYRQYLPEEIKSHSSHDVLLLCCDCHATMEKRSHIMRMMIAKQYGVPLENDHKVYITNSPLVKASKAALVLKKQIEGKNGKGQIPDSKLQEMKKEILDYLNKEEYTTEDLDSLVSTNPKQRNDQYVPHEKKVMEKVLELGEKGIFDFVRTWRKNFIETAQPKHLNPHWSIDKEILNDYKPKDQKVKQIKL
ncbi:hypothetical protein DICPUDRAFT_146576 [Dictyostelium purpureum]|uniref:3'-5' exonuclease domain-containing protein n=1 Tax=Dictyostelium purpureum TaxID=5786 RepID=F0Z6B6_DICPU|nr:uncharacterized protein DICPUDRAFT_146576 [Dictyostelium purpureum]EGC40462.1 hypothetical protein DICPUDRAFT_146576 [Dictyostelium purpureum]|eukprot:XP_003283009.1 hypothetical protein DICPUDRAFT_146576 [Dictyostelium purpureum]